MLVVSFHNSKNSLLDSVTLESFLSNQELVNIISDSPIWKQTERLLRFDTSHSNTDGILKIKFHEGQDQITHGDIENIRDTLCEVLNIGNVTIDSNEVSHGNCGVETLTGHAVVLTTPVGNLVFAVSNEPTIDTMVDGLNAFEVNFLSALNDVKGRLNALYISNKKSQDVVKPVGVLTQTGKTTYQGKDVIAPTSADDGIVFEDMEESTDAAFQGSQGYNLVFGYATNDKRSGFVKITVSDECTPSSTFFDCGFIKTLDEQLVKSNLGKIAKAAWKGNDVHVFNSKFNKEVAIQDIDAYTRSLLAEIIDQSKVSVTIINRAELETLIVQGTDTYFL